jgi:hypothetical protein
MTNAGSDNKISEMHVELKYCERCGGLWLRQCGIPRVYCADCVPRIAELPPPSKELQTVKLPLGPLAGLLGRGIDLFGVGSNIRLNIPARAA